MKRKIDHLIGDQLFFLSEVDVNEEEDEIISEIITSIREDIIKLAEKEIEKITFDSGILLARKKNLCVTTISERKSCE